MSKALNFLEKKESYQATGKKNMSLKKYVSGICLVAGLIYGCSDSGEEKQSELTNYVDPFIGTAGKGKTYPGATVPFGMVQLSPDNGRNGWDWISGYFYPDSVISGFSHLHLSGTGAGDLCDISFLPVSGKEKQTRLDSVSKRETVHSGFSHSRESAEPGYYQVYLDDYQVDVELTATTRSGLQRYNYDRTDSMAVRLHLGYARNWDWVTDSQLKVVNDSTITGYRKSSGWARDQRVYFYTVFSKPFSAFAISENDTLVSDVSEIRGKNVLGKFFFDESQGGEIMVKTAISSVSMANAKANLEDEQSGFDFGLVRKQALARWENELSKIQVETTEDDKIQFYTAMYHSMLAPITFSDVNGEYKGPDGSIHQADYIRYSIFSLWDTFRAWHPLATLLYSDRVPDMMQSLMGHYEEYGKLPVWNMHGNETDMMLGYHSLPVLADAYFKGQLGEDPVQTYEAMKKSAMQDEFGIKAYKELGYVPYDSLGWNVSLTMEYAFDDWCLAQVAKDLGKEEDYEYFMNRSKNYQNHFDSASRFFRAKSLSGNFRSPFDPLAYHPEDYAEANAWQYYWFAPQDIDGLIALTGGNQAFEKKLDALFETSQSAEETPVWISGNIGQYIHGNEPSHHVPYLYRSAGVPNKGEQRIRQILDELYTTQPDGLCGNEDCGQMSAWYIFSALGFYPVNPADGKYILGSPSVEEATIILPDNKSFTINAINQSKQNVFVKSVSLNGQQVSRNFITHEDVVRGGELVFEMTNQPDNN
ncbi:GH92 family glycosyl hydrolase [Reichenbachiella sp.]|uniref:GH92 family glycosyl hydrolase n=2 Tax=Reichenbachiella sp. TaxID=2184521 RepID=UPI003299AEE2